MMTTTTKFPVELTQAVYEALSAPVPDSEISTKSRGGRSFRFTSDQFVYHRLNEVVGPGGWQTDFTVELYPTPIEKGDDTFVGVIVCRLKVLGVMRSATVELEYNPRMYGTPSTNAQARALKRAAMQFGIASELWEKEESPTTTSPRTSAPTKRGKGVRLNDKQAAVLTDKGFKKEDVERATSFDIVGEAIAASRALGMKRGDRFTREQIEYLLENKPGADIASLADEDYEDDYEEDEEE